MDDNDEAEYGPALPPHLLKKQTNSKIIGPSFLSSTATNQKEYSENASSSRNTTESNDDDDEDIDNIVGPQPPNETSQMTEAQLQLEQRALEIKLGKIDPSNSGGKDDIKRREDWMLELPAIRTLEYLQPTNRKFRMKGDADYSDRSSWTDTPESKAKKAEKHDSKSTASSSSATAEEQALRVRDAEQERLAQKEKKKKKRNKSLLEIHQKKLKKKHKKEKKSEKAERRPFSRDTDLQSVRLNSAQTKTVIEKAKLLDSRFSSGKAKYL